MKSTQIAVYARLKPCPKAILHQDYQLKFGETEDQITPPPLNENSPNTKRFRFKKIFCDENDSQEKIFHRVAKPIIKDVLSGFNGMILTFGQTGTGKSYTMSGNTENSKNHGLILRTIKEIFREKKSTIIKVSYCEIYNERVYDLIGNLNFQTDGVRLTQVKNLKITIFRDLCVYEVKTVHDALQLFNKGNENKTTAVTEDGCLTSRSHVIFSIYVESPCTEDGMLRLNPVLILVELSSAENREGSGSQLDARSNNLSLQYLEQAVLAFRRNQKAPLSYRKSRMTAFFKNAFEGNYLITAVATLSLAVNDVEKTVQTCQLAEKLEQITNVAHPSEIIVPLKKILNPVQDIKLLENHYKFLKTQLNVLLKNQLPEEELDKDEKAQCAALVQKFIAGSDINEMSDFDIRKTIYCFHLLRKEILKKGTLMESQVKLNLSDLSFNSTNDTLLQGSEEISEKNLKNFTPDFVSPLEEKEGEQGNENNVPKNAKVSNENEIIIPEAVVDTSDILSQKPSEEYVLVHENIADRSKIVLRIAKLEEMDVSSNESKF